jgi:NADH-quinone oxidoreductase subunit E
MEGSARLTAEAEKILRIRPGETTSNGLFSLEITTCLGGCHNAPVVQVNEDYFIRLTPAEFRNLIKKL